MTRKQIAHIDTLLVLDCQREIVIVSRPRFGCLSPPTPDDLPRVTNTHFSRDITMSFRIWIPKWEGEGIQCTLLEPRYENTYETLTEGIYRKLRQAGSPESEWESQLGSRVVHTAWRGSLTHGGKQASFPASCLLAGYPASLPAFHSLS